MASNVARIGKSLARSVDRGRMTAEAAAATDPEHTLAVMDSIAAARRRIQANVPPALALEAMLVAAVRKSAA